MLKKLRSYFETKADTPPEHKERIHKLERIIDSNIDNPFIFIRALRHRSTLVDDNYSSTDSYERLEFLGDAVLDLIVTEIIFDKFSEENEGFLTKLRAKLVNGDALAHYAKELELHTLLVLGDRVRGQGIEHSKSVLADIFEALVGALYLDQGYIQVSEFVQKVIEDLVDFDQIIDTLDNYKSLLLEFAQANQMEIPVYNLVSESGPGHNKTFVVQVLVDNQPKAEGSGKSKKQAEQQAARRALQKLKK